MSKRIVTCSRCGKKLEQGMEIEYSGHLVEYYCSPDCATDRYFEYMDSVPVQFGHWEASGQPGPVSV